MKCSYCTREIEKGTGVMYVRKTGAIKYYCSDRCYNFDAVQGKKQRAKEIKGLTKPARK
ncbi:MAG: 50S ribosomal protein L24e [Candidatus Micrarchaeota archaeon]|nr:50S ribosomal protein L24e [Candidatus Micrarchaeota archaeon]